MDSKLKLANLQENVSLANHTTFRIGGPAKYFVAVKDKGALVEVIKWAKGNSLPFFILGGGSNLLVADDGYDGLIIKCQMSNFQCKEEEGRLIVVCDSGVSFGKIILETTKKGYSGAEWGFGIPGTIGGAICGNAGRLGQSIVQVVVNVTVLDEGLTARTLSKSECDFGYRESRFKKDKKNKEIILSAVLAFDKKDPALIKKVLNEAKAVVKHSPPFPSAGCIFKNYTVASSGDPLLLSHPELRERVRGGKLGVGHLIDQCGLKGKQIGGAKIWEGHANYTVNVGGAKAQDVLGLIKSVKEAVAVKYGIELQEEVRYLGNFKL